MKFQVENFKLEKLSHPHMIQLSNRLEVLIPETWDEDNVQNLLTVIYHFISRRNMILTSTFNRKIEQRIENNE
jgi:hypothetical protein